MTKRLLLRSSQSFPMGKKNSIAQQRVYTILLSSRPSAVTCSTRFGTDPPYDNNKSCTLQSRWQPRGYATTTTTLSGGHFSCSTSPRNDAHPSTSRHNHYPQQLRFFHVSSLLQQQQDDDDKNTEKPEMSAAEKKKALKKAAKEKLAKEAAEKEAAEKEAGTTNDDDDNNKKEEETPSTTTTTKEEDGQVYERYNPKKPDWDKYEKWENPLLSDDPKVGRLFPEEFEEGEEFPVQPLPDFEKTYPDHIEALAEEMVHLNMLEVNELMTKILEFYDIDEKEMRRAVVGDEEEEEDGDDDEDGADAAPAEEAKTVFDLKLVEYDAKAKIKVIKEVRSIGGLGLKEAKEVVESVPKIIQQDLKKEDAEELKAKLEELGATVEIV